MEAVKSVWLSDGIGAHTLHKVGSARLQLTDHLWQRVLGEEDEEETIKGQGFFTFMIKWGNMLQLMTYVFLSCMHSTIEESGGLSGFFLWCCSIKDFLGALKHGCFGCITQTRSNIHMHVNTYVCVFCYSSNSRQFILCIPYISQHLAAHRYTSSPAFTLSSSHRTCAHANSQNACTRHTVVVVHCSFIHSCGGLQAWLGTASFFNPLSPSLPFPKGLIHHKPTTPIVQHTGFIQSHYFFEAHFCLLASPASTELLSVTGYYCWLNSHEITVPSINCYKGSVCITFRMRLHVMRIIKRSGSRRMNKIQLFVEMRDKLNHLKFHYQRMLAGVAGEEQIFSLTKFVP